MLLIVMSLIPVELARAADVTVTISAPVPPVIETQEVTNRDETTATLYAKVLSLGTYDIDTIGFNWGETIAYGSNWSESSGPYVAGDYTHDITGLNVSTTYHYRFFIIEDGHTMNGDDIEFVTLSPTYPTVDTGEVADKTTTSATLQGNLVGLGSYSTVYVSFEYGLTTSYGAIESPTADEEMTAIGGFNVPISNLEPGTTYHFQARVRYDSLYKYGGDNTFTTVAKALPVISASGADDITSNSALLWTSLSTLGDYSPLFAYYEYGEDASYGTQTMDQPIDETGFYTQPISSLASNTLYHYRTVIKYDSSTVEGIDRTFTTIFELLPPTGLNATRGDTTIDLSWIKDNEATNTMIRRDTVSYPDSTLSGTQVYLGIGASIVDTGLSNTQVYYYSAWSEKDSIYSSSYITVYSSPEGMGEGMLPVPDYMGLSSVLIVESYQVAGDQLIVFKYDISYITDPSQDAKDFFRFEIHDGVDIVASGPVMAWGEKPGSIYLSPSNALTWEQAFTLKLTGIPGQWGDDVPVKSYSVASPSWVYDRTTLDKLDIWVFTIATVIDTDWILTTTVGDFLTDEACTIFNKAIGGLSSIRTEICYYGTAYPEYEDPDFSEEGQEALTREANLGSYINDLLDDTGSLVGMTGDSMGTMVMAFICLTLMIVIGAITRNAGWAMISTVPVISFGNYIGLIGLAFTLIITSIIVLYFYYTIWIRGV